MILDLPSFKSGEIDTGFIPKHADELATPPPPIRVRSPGPLRACMLARAGRVPPCRESGRRRRAMSGSLPCAAAGSVTLATHVSGSLRYAAARSLHRHSVRQPSLELRFTCARADGPEHRGEGGQARGQARAQAAGDGDRVERCESASSVSTHHVPHTSGPPLSLFEPGCMLQRCFRARTYVQRV